MLLTGRAGGQSGVGGTAAGEEWAIRGSAAANLGLIRAQSPIVFDNTLAAATLSTYFIAATPTQAMTAGFVGGGVNISPSITFSSAFFIWEGLRAAPTIESLVAPGFAAFTLFQALPILTSASSAFNQLNALVLNAGVVTEFTGAAGSTTATTAAINWAPQLRATTAGGTANWSTATGLQCRPVFSTVLGTVVNLGTIRAVWAQEPSAALFQPSAGTETMTAYVAVDMDNVAFGGNVTKAAVRSAQAAATNAFFLLQTGAAQSRFVGEVQLRSNTVGLRLGTADTVGLRYDGTRFLWTWVGGDQLRWQNFTALNYWAIDSNVAAQGIQFDLEAITFGTTAANPGSLNNFVQFAAPNLRTPSVAGEYADVLWTAGGTLDINGLAMTNVSAFAINSPAVILSGGTISDLSNLFVNAMPSFGATRMQALRVLGRSRLDGLMTHNQATLAQLTANVAALALPANNLGRFVLFETADALGPWTIQGIVNVQVGDSLYIVNTGANSFLLGHQDAGAAAANRIISPTGASLTLAANQMAKLWYDSAATRWRILEHTGT